MERRDTGGKATQSRRRGRRDRILDVAEALLWIGLLVFGSLVALAVLREGPGPAQSDSSRDLLPPSGLVEAEDMPVVGRSRSFSFWLQPTSSFPGGRWSKDGHMFAFGTQKGDWVELELPAGEPGRYRLELFLTKAADYGIVTVSLNGARIGSEIDLWSDRGVVPTGPLDRGVVELRGRGDVLRLEVGDTNPAASPRLFQFGIDGIRLTKP